MNCQKGKLVTYKTYSKLTIYTFKPDGEECLFDQFIGKFENNKAYRPCLDKILAAVSEFVKRGIDPRRFRPKVERAIEALPSGISKLRLYCVPYGQHAILIGNGDVKSTLRVQDCPNCGPHWKFLTLLDKEIQERLLSKEITWQKTKGQDKLNGNLSFEIGDCE
ncbi:hypothetical protein [Chitinophaga arvensicola]|uniref:Uncharacterized protein n=1 Tax=Chitinophaga arvensicola TaxID=29529 RepID=A0A1I0R2U2_9BACT|nr:hypothetical protein [Chitinophaga arvensicola]SEW34229.1 hypothetical protein SAMN04488122_2078 [Chitinophaga arvensicola]